MALILIRIRRQIHDPTGPRRPSLADARAIPSRWPSHTASHTTPGTRTRTRTHTRTPWHPHDLRLIVCAYGLQVPRPQLLPLHLCTPRRTPPVVLGPPLRAGKAGNH